MKIIHVGLPRTATTTLQKNFFLNFKDVIYVGKDHSNFYVDNIDISNVQKILNNESYRKLPEIFSTVVVGYKDAIIKGNFERISIFLAFLKTAFQLIESHAEDVHKKVLWSDESLIESLSGLNATKRNHDASLDSLPIITLKQFGIIAPDDELVITFRNPIDWIVSSYHRTCRLFHDAGKAELVQSLDDYISAQLTLYQHTPVASRLFWCHQVSAINFLNNLHRNIRTINFNELILSDKPYQLIVPGSELIDDVNAKFLIENKGVSDKLDIEIYKINNFNIDADLHQLLKKQLYMNHSEMIKNFDNQIFYLDHKS
jgi:hypothetical protein